MRIHLALRLSIVFVISGCYAVHDGHQEESCQGPLGKPVPRAELSGMTAYCQAQLGKAQCLAAVPDDIKPMLGGCDTGGYCIPDSFLVTGGSEPPATCTAFGGQGVCLSRCIPQVEENAAALRKDTCTGADELCVPCISPLDGM